MPPQGDRAPPLQDHPAESPCEIGGPAVFLASSMSSYVTGVTLPLLSYGGTSVLTVMAAMGLLLNINLRRTVF